MSYLTIREVIHKDLDARNCVIDDTLQVKITDNALSRDLFPMDYHCLGDNEIRPVRWMALKSLANNKFSSASDVSAFGVTLWELMTLGQMPLCGRTQPPLRTTSLHLPLLRFLLLPCPH
ncbi:Tyrosine-protein kinase RYK [Lemmus lemmus]